MGRSKINAFDAARIRHGYLIARQPVRREMLLDSLGQLEACGEEAIQNGQLGKEDYAAGMRAIFDQIPKLEVRPPLTEPQVRMFGRMAANLAS